MSTNDRAVIAFTNHRWHATWSSRHRIVTGLGRLGWSAIFSSGPVSFWRRDKEEWQRAAVFGGFEKTCGIDVDLPGKVEVIWPRFPRMTLVSTRRHASRLRKRARSLGAREIIALVFHPSFWPEVESLSPDRIVYFAYDAYSLAPGWDAELAGYETELVRSADLVVAFSRLMLDLMPAPGPEKGRELPTAVDPDQFSGKGSNPCPVDMSRIRGPRICYAGSINEKLNFDLVVDLVQRRRDWQWIFFGRVVGSTATPDGRHYDIWEGLKSQPNFHYLGDKPMEEVPAYMAHADVNIMCYRTDSTGWWYACSPLKLYEYLASGPPIVGSRLAAFRGFEDVVAICDSHDDWYHRIEDALDSGGVGTVEQRRGVAESNSWDSRISTLSSWMNAL